MFKKLIGRLALYYCREILICERDAAIVSRRTLSMGMSGMMPLEQAVSRTVSGMDYQIAVLDALLGNPPTAQSGIQKDLISVD